MTKVRIKVCGITNLDDALGSAEAGADLLGFNFYSGSPRQISPEAARAIIEKLPAGLVTVGIFVNEESPGVIKELVETAKVDAIQLHGEEPPEFCRSLRAILPGRFLVKALRVGPDFNARQALAYEADAILLDAFDGEARGGTGKTFDWAKARQMGEKQNVFLAGGLSPENVVEAIAAVQPYGVDACSQLETTPGQKDLTRVRAFVQAVRKAEGNHGV